MVRRTFILYVAVLLGVACSTVPPEPPPPPPLDPTGTFDVSIEVGGFAVAGVLAIRGTAEGGYTGSLDTDMGGADLSSIAVEGQDVTFTINIPEAFIEFRVTYEGDEFTGFLDGSMGGGPISGVRR